LSAAQLELSEKLDHILGFRAAGEATRRPSAAEGSIERTPENAGGESAALREVLELVRAQGQALQKMQLQVDEMQLAANAARSRPHRHRANKSRPPGHAERAAASACANGPESESAPNHSATQALLFSSIGDGAHGRGATATGQDASDAGRAEMSA
jgi:hypothetical protein